MSSTSGSDHEMSESTSPHSYTTKDSPYSSPSQQVPQLTIDLNTLTCVDKNLYNFKQHGTGPYLEIVEQPQNHFRFRYVSEMVGTHGCLLAKNNNGAKKHPTVELKNYTGRALIRCQLVQHDNRNEHPHKLTEEDEDKDVAYQVPEKGIYKVGFPGIGIIHTAKKDVANLLFKKYSEGMKNTKYNAKELRARCEVQAKEINLNIVRLMFTAHDLTTGKEICEAVFSNPIHNMKSALTNEMKICRISMCSGRPQGGDDVFILVEKVNKKNIMIRFYELDNVGKEVWTDKGNFLQSDVHHQYAIVFRTPPYKDPCTPVDVKVYIELVRPSDGTKSEPKEFTYKADPIYKAQSNSKKRRFMYSPYSSLSSSDGSITNELPITVLSANGVKEEMELAPAVIQLPLQPSSPSQCDLGNALNGISLGASPMWMTQAPVPPFPDLRLDSEEMTRMAHTALPPEENITDEIYTLYADSFNSSLNDLPSEMNDMGFVRCSTNISNHLIPDSGRAKVESSTSSKQTIKEEKSRVDSDYAAHYTVEEGAEVKQLVKDLCEIIRTKTASRTQEARNKLQRLFEIRLSNRDTFLHMALCCNQASFETVVKLVHSAKMSHVLNYTNYNEQTILHLAVVHSTPEIIKLLISKGCDPNLRDVNGDNAIHYAVRYNTQFLGPLLETMQKYNVSCDLDATNSDKQSALHLCSVYDSPSGARLLVEAGASVSVRDELGRSPIHLAAYDGRAHVLRALLTGIQASEVDCTDGQGNTALQIVCGRAMDEHTLSIVKLLLEKKADPSKHGDHNESAFKLSRDKPEVRELLLRHAPQNLLEEELKTEPEDEYESAEEDIEAGLPELGSYIEAVSTLVDKAGAWRALADRLQVGALNSWFTNQPSPARTILSHVKESRHDITSRSLALILDDIGLTEAADIIRSHIE